VLAWAPRIVLGLVSRHSNPPTLEELGLQYEEKVVSTDEQRTESYLDLQPFGQVPEFEDNDIQHGAIIARARHVAPNGVRARRFDWSSPGFVDIPGSVISARGVTHGKA